MHIPGIKVVLPSNPFDAKGLLKTAIRDDSPVIFLEHKLLYAAGHPAFKDYPGMLCHVPEQDYCIPFGRAAVKTKGDDVTVVATMMMVHKSLVAAKILAQEGIGVEVIDPRTLVPFDLETVLNSVEKTGRLVVVSEDTKRAGAAAERRINPVDAVMIEPVAVQPGRARMRDRPAHDARDAGRARRRHRPTTPWSRRKSRSGRSGRPRIVK